MSGRVIKGAVLACAAIAAVPTVADAAWLGFRNELKTPVIILSQNVVNGAVNPREKPRIQVLAAGEISLDPVIQPVHKLIEVREPKTNRLLFREIRAVARDTFFAVQLQPPDKVKLVETKLPTPPKRSTP
jgi:hypothetical protein